jgi:hypothetical protein
MREQSFRFHWSQLGVRSILTLVLCERSKPSTRPRGLARSAILRSAAAMVTVGLVCAGCGGGGNRTGPQIPDVSGQQAHVALMHLRQSGYEHFFWAGRWSNQPVGTVLGTRPAAGTTTPHAVRLQLVMSQGQHTRPSRLVMVPGIGTFDVDPPPLGVPLAGGPVLLPDGR